MGYKLTVQVWLVKFLFPPTRVYVSGKTAACKNGISKELAADCTALGCWTIGPFKVLYPSTVF